MVRNMVNNEQNSYTKYKAGIETRIVIFPTRFSLLEGCQSVLQCILGIAAQSYYVDTLQSSE